MAHDRNSDPAMDKALRRSLSESLDASGKDCPDASILAAYFDRELSAAETDRWETHFSVCTCCQEQLAVLARTEPAVAVEPAAAGWRRFWTLRPAPSGAGLRSLAPLATAAAAVVLWVAIRPEPPTMPAPPATVASRRAAEVPEQPAAKPPAKEAETGLVNAKPAVEADKLAGADKRALADQTVASGRLEATAPKVPAPAQEVAQAGRADHEYRVEMQAAKPAGALTQEKLEARAEAPQPPVGALEKKQAENAAVQAAAAPRDQAQQPVVVADAAHDEGKARSREEAPAAPAEGMRSKMAVADLQKAAPGRPEALGGLIATRGQVVVAAPKGSVLWRFGVRGLIEKSTDAGKTWSRLQSPVTVDLVAGSAPSEKVCWAIGASGVVLRTDDGQRWEQVASPTTKNLNSITARDGQNATVTTADGKTFVTADGGQTWRER